MHARLNVVTLAVRDLATSFAFHQNGLGLRGRIVGTEYVDSVSGASGTIALFELRSGLMLALYPRTDFIKDANVPDSGRPSQVEFSLGYLAKSRDDVDAVLGEAIAAGARITEAPRERAWGIYSVYLSDPDGHLWEIIYNRAARARDNGAKPRAKLARRTRVKARR